MDIGFCGPGLMGAPMIRHLLRAGHAVHVWNRTREKAEALAPDGAQVVATPRELASCAEVVLLCVADAAAVEAVVFGEQGVLGSLGLVPVADHTGSRGGRGAALPAQGGEAPPGQGGSALLGQSGSAPRAHGSAASRVRLIVDHSSIPPAATRTFAERAREAGVGWVDAPVSGGVAGAQAGTLAVMAGGDEADVAAVMPLVAAYAARITRMGGSGAGQTTKLCNQAIVTATVAAIAEAVSLAQRSGIEAAKLAEALAGGWADSALLQTFVPRMTQRDLVPIGALKTFQKDVETIAAAAAATGTPMPVSGTVQQLLRLGVAMGLADADLSAFIDVLQMPRTM
ncbi:NAD(P)-dependent oxidoreductase [Paraburkholderia kururiensis]|uniref:NAD(P)-dependent oxidoreductase n=1 Tax=Paraburkholderia kururiensis TaxID=984307 RepID=UPI000348CF68|nr:NAD(P)-dependent oxidoreductase [Paraburkholderia kururiensis]